MRKKSDTKTVLIAVSDLLVSGFIQSVLEESGYEALIAENAETARRMLAAQAFDIMLADLNNIETDKISIATEVKKNENIPVVALISGRDAGEKSKALRYGADDFITKPFGTKELISRIAAVTEAADAVKGNTKTGDIIRSGELVIDRAEGYVTVDGEAVHMTSDEYKVLTLIAEQYGKVVSRDYLTKSVFGANGENEQKLLNTAVANVRTKLGENPENPLYISTEIGAGYRMLNERI